MLWKLIREEQPDYLAIAWDPPGPTFRDALSAEYKATRADGRHDRQHPGRARRRREDRREADRPVRVGGPPLRESHARPGQAPRDPRDGTQGRAPLARARDAEPRGAVRLRPRGVPPRRARLGEAPRPLDGARVQPPPPRPAPTGRARERRGRARARRPRGGRAV